MRKFRFSALRIKKSWLEGDTVDPDLEFAKYGEAEDLVDPRAPAPPPAQNQALLDITENTFNAYSEPREAAFLIVSEDKDSAARFRLKTKFEGVVLRDETEEYDEYRRCVDLEWCKTGKDPAYGGKAKGWHAVCEKIEGKHDEDIANAEGKLDLILDS